jgi:hypothetical protein
MPMRKQRFQRLPMAPWPRIRIRLAVLGMA